MATRTHSDAGHLGLAKLLDSGIFAAKNFRAAARGTLESGIRALHDEVKAALA